MSTSAITFSLPRYIVPSLVLCVLVLMAAYMYFLSASILHVVMRTEVEQSIQSLSSEISVLEGDYIAAQHKVSQRISMHEGFEEVGSKTFIDRGTAVLVLNQ